MHLEVIYIKRYYLKTFINFINFQHPYIFHYVQLADVLTNDFYRLIFHFLIRIPLSIIIF